MKKFVILSVLMLFALLGMSAGLAAAESNCVLSLPAVEKTFPRVSDSSMAPVESESSQAWAFHIRYAEQNVINGSLSRTTSVPRLLSSRLVLSIFELARLLALELPDGSCYLATGDFSPRIVAWLESSVEVRAGPAFVLA